MKKSQINPPPPHPNFQELKLSVPRPIWRHEAIVAGLTPGQRVPYQVTSQADDWHPNRKPHFYPGPPAPQAGQPTKVLLTSDHQSMPMTGSQPAEGAGNHRAGGCRVSRGRSGQYSRSSLGMVRRIARGCAFFPCLQGLGDYALERNGQTVSLSGRGADSTRPPYFRPWATTK